MISKTKPAFPCSGAIASPPAVYVLFLSLAFSLPARPGLRASGGDGIEWNGPPLNAPGLSHRVFASEAAGTKVSYHIYLPPAYETETERRFPVIYWLHGGGGDREEGVGMRAGGGRGPIAVSQLYGEAMREGRIPEAILVFPNGLRGSLWCDSSDGTTPVETILMKELIPEVDRRFRTVASREGRLIEGFSMGGFGAARLGFRYPETFAGASLLGAGPLQEVFVPGIGPKRNARLRARVLEIVFDGDQDSFRRQSPRHLAKQRAADLKENFTIRQVIGEKDFTLEANIDFSEFLHSLEIPHRFEVLENIGHDPMRLLAAMGGDNEAFYREIFGSESGAKPESEEE